METLIPKPWQFRSTDRARCYSCGEEAGGGHSGTKCLFQPTEAVVAATHWIHQTDRWFEVQCYLCDLHFLWECPETVALTEFNPMVMNFKEFDVRCTRCNLRNRLSVVCKR